MSLLFHQQRSLAQRLTAGTGVWLVLSSAIAPAALASTASAGGGLSNSPLPRPTAPPRPATAAPPLPAAPAPAPAGPALPELWSPRVADIADTDDAGSAAALFDGDARTALGVAARAQRSVRIELGAAKQLLGIGVIGDGAARLTVQIEDDSGRHAIDGMTDRQVSLAADRWTSLTSTTAPTASRLVLTWFGSPAGAQLREVALWVTGRARDALSEARLTDRLVTSLPDNAVEARARPEIASVTRVTPNGPQSAQLVVKLDRDPALFGRVFLVYELERLAHWTGPSRSINGHALRGGYRAGLRGLGGVQVEEISAAWLHRGDNAITFTPSQTEDGLGYVVRNARVVGTPPGAATSDLGAGRGKPGVLDDGSADTSLGGPGIHTAKLRAPGANQPAYFAFQLAHEGTGTIIVSSLSADRHRRGQVEIDLAGRAPGWQSVPLGGVLPASPEPRVTVSSRGEGTARLTEARLLSYPSLAGDDPIAIAYPLHGECFDHEVYLRGFARGGGSSAGATLVANHRAQAGAVDTDGSFATIVPEPAAARGKPWTIDLSVTTAGGGHATRTVPIDRCVEPPRPRVAGVSPPIEDAGAPFAAVVSPHQARVLSFGDATLEIPAGAVDRDVRVTIRPLPQEKLAPLGQLMTNVTPGGGAYRFGPHGIVFKKPVKLTLPVDPARVPAGMAARDVQTFYYDEGHGKWITIGHRASGREQVVAMTGHFTDFINATLAVPDHPDAQRFNPNSIKELKLGDPDAGITLIAPPQADSSGAAHLRYSIETPPGRSGVQPEIALVYNSDRVNTNGWLGVGWDLELPSIEVDTRFGVPRYDGSSETYLLDGAMLAPNGDGTFRRRVEGRFDRIERKGTGPSDFSWEVTDKSGTRFIYGVGSNARLSDPRGGAHAPNIFKWHLESIRDTFGNFMSITYAHDTFAMGRETFDQVYPAQIDYTGGPSLAPAYHVFFKLDDGSTRPDRIITGRPGFPVATRRRLSQIDVAFGSTPIRSYVFEYDDANLASSFEKSRLKAVALRAAPANPSTELYRHTFDYESAPPTDGMFASETNRGDFTQASGDGRTDDGLSHAQDVLFGASGSVGIGLPLLFSATASAGADTGDTTPDLLFLDANGDGLPDQMEQGGHVSLNSIFGAAEQHLASAQFPGLGGVGHTSRSGWTTGGSLSALSGLFGAGVGYANHSADEESLVGDMDGDGFPDVVFIQDGVVGTLRNTGNHAFAAPVAWDGYSLGGVTFSHQDRFDQARQQAGAFFPADPLIRWVAPFGGTIKVDTTLAKVSPGGDGVRADLFVDNTLRWTCSFAPGDTNPCVQSVTTPVAAGDRVYLKVDALESPTKDELVSSTEISYQVDASMAGLREPYGRPIYRFNQSDDFTLAGRPYATFTASAVGDLEVSPCFEKDSTADDVTVSVVHKRGGTVIATYARDVPATSTGSFCIDSLPHPLSVQQDDSNRDTLTFQVSSDAQIDPTTLRWPAMVAYQSYCRVHPITRDLVCGAPVCQAGFCSIGPSDPLPRFPIPEALVRTKPEVFYPARQWTSTPAAATQTFAVPGGGSPPVSWTLSTGETVGGTFVPGPRMLVLVQGVNRLIAKTLLDSSHRSITIDESPPVQAGEQLFFTVFFPDGEPPPGQPFLVGTPTVDGASAPFNLRFADPTLDNNGVTQVDAMSGGYHRWFYGDWNGDRTFDESQIHPTFNPQDTDTFMFASPAPYGLLSRPDLGQIQMWLGRGSGAFMAAGRINPGFTSTGASTGSVGNVSALKSSDTWNLDLEATAAVVNADLNTGDSTTNIDFFDVNGDGLPDSVTRDQVQFNQGVVDPLTGRGGFAGRESIPMGFPADDDRDLRSTTNGAFRLGFSAAGVGHMINLANAKSESSKTVDTSVASASTDYGLSSTRTDFLDINGDGLLDHVKREPGGSGNVRVALNLGYGFSNEITWAGPGWSEDHVAPDLSVFGQHNVVADLTSDVVEAALDALDIVPGHEVRIKNTNVLRLSDSQTNNLSVGVPGKTFGAGGGPNASLTRQLVDFVDMNGDGLPDQVLRNPNESQEIFHVKLNQGDHFGPEQIWSIPGWTTDISLPGIESLPHPDGVSYSTLAGWGVSMNFEVCFFLCVGGSSFYSRDNGGANVAFEDVDGDGKPDQVLKKVDDATLHVKLNQTGKTNLLRAVHRPLGGTIALDYKRVGNNVVLDASPRIDMPANQWALASVTVSSGNPASEPQPEQQTIDYSGATPGVAVGFHDRTEREGYGYADVKTVFADGSSLVRTYSNQDYYQKELPLSTTWTETDLTPPAPSQVLKRETYTYADPAGRDPATQPPRTGSLFPAPRDIDTFLIENDPAGRAKHHQQTRRFDTAGNLTDSADVGDVDFADPGDDFNYHLDYVHPDAAGLITRPSAVTATTGLGAIGNAPPGTLLRRRTATYSAAGKPITVTDAIAGGKDPATGAPRTESSPALATWAVSYDPFGNVQTATGPEGHAFAYEYDAPTQTHRTKTTDSSFGYVSTEAYDLRFGVPTVVVDIDGAREEIDFDDFGRMLRAFGPNDFDSAGARTSPSLVFDYSEQPHGTSGFVEALPASATTSHENVVPPEMSRPGDPIPSRPSIRTVTFIDGLERVIQTKNDITHDDGQGNVADGMSVSGAIQFDVRGRAAKQGQAVFRDAGTDFAADVPMLNPTSFAYDALSRERQVARPDSSSVDAAAHGNQAVTTTSYQLGQIDGKLQLLTLVSDARGEVRSIYRSVRAETVAVDEVNKIRGTDNVHLVTRYGYDPLSQLTTITDAKENLTTAIYDTVGQLVTLTNPDAGRTEWRYDRAGNRVVKETANLRAAGKLINYVFNKDRLEAIAYPDSADVQYVYGDAAETGGGHGFVAGRVKTRVDESGQVDFAYDGLGDVVKETHALVSLLPSQKDGYHAVMTYSYDSFGRMIDMQFPGTSAEIVRYGYDAGGMVTSARGLATVVKPPNQNPDSFYLNHIGYDEFGKRTRLVNGNGVESRYAYEGDTRRLSHVDTDFIDKKGPAPMQRLRYAYDVVSNVRTLRNDVPIDGKINPVAVGPTSYTFDYDRLYQLTHVDGLYQPSANKRFRHSLDYGYDEIANISRKTQQDFQDQTGKNGIFQEGNPIPQTTYDLGYSYGGAAPHAVTHVDEALHQNLIVARDFAHDADGNQTGWTLTNGQTRVEAWTEENRLRQVTDQGHVLGQYLYSADGARTHNVADGREIVYVNQYLNVRNNGPTITKHIYAGDTRIASKLDGDASPPSATFYYHPDHIQSTQYTTTDDGSLSEHVEYFASGEPWQQERTNLLANIRPEFLFTGKEFDTLTGFYYFGARYYDPVVQNWQSTDPILDSYLTGRPNGGLYNPATLALYTYGENNPLAKIDPNGQEVRPKDPKQKKYLEGLINARALGHFKFDKNNKLVRTSKKGNAKAFSSYYADKLEAAINSKEVITLEKTKTFKTVGGLTIDLDERGGGGLTEGDKGGKQTVAISGHANKSLKDANGKPLREDAADILQHEMLGHAIPHIVGSDTGNAVKNENKARAQEAGAAQRPEEPEHTEE